MSPWEADYRQGLDAEGAAMVRLKLQAGLIPSPHISVALSWLAEKEASEARRLSAIRRKAQTTTTISAIAAIVAAVSSIIAIIVAVVTWWLPRH